MKKSDKKSTTNKASLKSTRETKLTKSFYDKVDALEIGPSRTSPYYENSKSFECNYNCLMLFRLI